MNRLMGANNHTHSWLFTVDVIVAWSSIKLQLTMWEITGKKTKMKKAHSLLSMCITIKLIQIDNMWEPWETFPLKKKEKKTGPWQNMHQFSTAGLPLLMSGLWALNKATLNTTGAEWQKKISFVQSDYPRVKAGENLKCFWPLPGETRQGQSPYWHR